MWERMQQSEGGSGGMDFLSTHPANERRIKAIRKWLPEVRPYLPYVTKASADDSLVVFHIPQADQLREDNCGPAMQSSKAFSQVAKFR